MSARPWVPANKLCGWCCCCCCCCRVGTTDSEGIIEQPSLPSHSTPSGGGQGSGPRGRFSRRVWLALLNMQTMKFCFVFVKKSGNFLTLNCEHNSIKWAQRKEQFIFNTISVAFRTIYLCLTAAQPHRFERAQQAMKKNRMHLNIFIFFFVRLLT